MALYGAAFDGEDLVQQAIIALLEGPRKWKPKRTSFMGVLIGTMRSFASNYKEKNLGSGYSIPDKQITSNKDDDQHRSLIERHPDARLNSEQQMLASEGERETIGFVEELYAFFGKDLEALLVMDCWKEGLSGTQIIETLEIDRKAYETIVRRIRRKSAAQWPKGSSHVS